MSMMNEMMRMKLRDESGAKEKLKGTGITSLLDESIPQFHTKFDGAGRCVCVCVCVWIGRWCQMEGHALTKTLAVCLRWPAQCVVAVARRWLLGAYEHARSRGFREFQLLTMEAGDYLDMEPFQVRRGPSFQEKPGGRRRRIESQPHLPPHKNALHALVADREKAGHG
jgi:hypothetical protein